MRFYDRYESALVAYFMRRSGNPELAADLTAEVFAAVLASASRYRPESPTAAVWLFTIARNTLSKSVRRGRVEAAARTRVGVRRVELRDESIERIEASSGGEDWVHELLAVFVGSSTAGKRSAVVQWIEPATGRVPTFSRSRPLDAAQLARPVPPQGCGGFDYCTIVPDGVARAKWVFRPNGASSDSRTITVYPTIRNNLAIYPLPRQAGELLSMTWYAADGHMISSLDLATMRARSRGQG